MQKIKAVMRHACSRGFKLGFCFQKGITVLICSCRVNGKYTSYTGLTKRSLKITTEQS